MLSLHALVSAAKSKSSQNVIYLMPTTAGNMAPQHFLQTH